MEKSAPRFFASRRTHSDPPSDSPTADAVTRRYGFDPTTALDARIGRTSDSVFKTLKESGIASVKSHILTDAERREMEAALAILPPLHKRILQARLRSVSFLDGLPNTGLTSIVNPDDAYQLFDITIRAGVLRQTASEWLTEKERSVFDGTGSRLQVAIEAGKRDALIFILLHEATHIVDLALGITPLRASVKPPKPSEAIPVAAYAFSGGVWSQRTVPAPPYRDNLRERIRFYMGGKPLPIDQAPAIYASLQKTPFVSLYGSSNWGDDLAEFVAVYHWTEVLKQPYRIVLRDSKKIIFTYEPMKSPLVRGRLPHMPPFYAPEK